MAAVLLIALVVANSGTADCGFPWTISAVPAGGQTVAIHVCGMWAGCSPRASQVTVAGSEILITLSTPGECGCVAIPTQVNQTILVSPLSPGNYSVTVIVLDCLNSGLPVLVGTTNFSLGGATSIPTLNAWGVLALALLVAIAGAYRLR